VARELHDTRRQTVLGSKYVADGVLLDPTNDPGRMLKARGMGAVYKARDTELDRELQRSSPVTGE